MKKKKALIWLAAAIAIFAVWYFFIRRPKKKPNDKMDGSITLPTIPTSPNGGVLGKYNPIDVFGYDPTEVYAFSGKRLIVPGYN